MTVNIRARTPADIAPAAQVLTRVHATDGYPVEGVTDPEGWLHSTHLLAAFVAEHNGNIIGHVAITAPQPSDAAPTLAPPPSDGHTLAVLGRLFVDPNARRSGAGQQLVTTAMAYASTHQLRLTLDVMDKDTAAIALYERLGWTRLGSIEHDAGDRTVSAVAMLAPN